MSTFPGTKGKKRPFPGRVHLPAFLQAKNDCNNWNFCRIYSQEIFEVYQKHTRKFNGKYLSRLMIGEVFYERVSEEGTDFDQSVFFQAVQVRKVSPIFKFGNNQRRIHLDCVEVPTAENSVLEEPAKSCKLIATSSLAELIEFLIQEDDVLLLFGDILIEGAKVIVLNSRQRHPLTIAHYRHDGILRPEEETTEKGSFMAAALNEGLVLRCDRFSAKEITCRLWPKQQKEDKTLFLKSNHHRNPTILCMAEPNGSYMESGSEESTISHHIVASTSNDKAMDSELKNAAPSVISSGNFHVGSEESLFPLGDRTIDGLPESPFPQGARTIAGSAETLFSHEARNMVGSIESLSPTDTRAPIPRRSDELGEGPSMNQTRSEEACSGERGASPRPSNARALHHGEETRKNDRGHSLKESSEINRIKRREARQLAEIRRNKLFFSDESSSDEECVRIALRQKMRPGTAESEKQEEQQRDRRADERVDATADEMVTIYLSRSDRSVFTISTISPRESTPKSPSSRQAVSSPDCSPLQCPSQKEDQRGSQSGMEVDENERSNAVPSPKCIPSPNQSTDSSRSSDVIKSPASNTRSRLSAFEISAERSSMKKTSSFSKRLASLPVDTAKSPKSVTKDLNNEDKGKPEGASGISYTRTRAAEGREELENYFCSDQETADAAAQDGADAICTNFLRTSHRNVKDPHSNLTGRSLSQQNINESEAEEQDIKSATANQKRPRKSAPRVSETSSSGRESHCQRLEVAINESRIAREAAVSSPSKPTAPSEESTSRRSNILQQSRQTGAVAKDQYQVQEGVPAEDDPEAENRTASLRKTGRSRRKTRRPSATADPPSVSTLHTARQSAVEQEMEVQHKSSDDLEQQEAVYSQTIKSTTQIQERLRAKEKSKATETARKSTKGTRKNASWQAPERVAVDHPDEPFPGTSGTSKLNHLRVSISQSTKKTQARPAARVSVVATKGKTTAASGKRKTRQRKLTHLAVKSRRRQQAVALINVLKKSNVGISPQSIVSNTVTSLRRGSKALASPNCMLWPGFRQASPNIRTRRARELTNNANPCKTTDECLVKQAKGMDKSKGHKFECRQCKLTFSESYSLKRHLSTSRAHNKGSAGFVCEICGKGFHRKDELGRHLVSHSAEPMTCKICLKELSHKITYLKHMRDMHPDAK